MKLVWLSLSDSYFLKLRILTLEDTIRCHITKKGQNLTNNCTFLWIACYFKSRYVNEVTLLLLSHIWIMSHILKEINSFCLYCWSYMSPGAFSLCKRVWRSVSDGVCIRVFLRSTPGSGVFSQTHLIQVISWWSRDWFGPPGLHIISLCFVVLCLSLSLSE